MYVIYSLHNGMVILQKNYIIIHKKRKRVDVFLVIETLMIIVCTKGFVIRPYKYMNAHNSIYLLQYKQKQI